MVNNLKRKIILSIMVFCICIQCLQVIGLYYKFPTAYAATTSGISFIYKKGYSVDGRGDARFHYLKKGKPTIRLTGLSGASNANKVKIKLYNGNTYYGVVSFAKTGSKQFSVSVPKGQYYLKVSGGSGDKNGWISGKGTINPVYK